MKSWVRWAKNLFIKESFVSYGDSTVMHLVRHNSDKLRIEEISPHQIEYKNKKNESLLSLAIKMGLNKLFIYILDKYPEYLDQVNLAAGDSLVMLSVRYNNLECFKYLMKKGANVNFISIQGDSLLNLCVAKPVYHELLVSNKNINFTIEYPIHRHPLVNAVHSSESIFVFLIRKGITKEMSTLDIIKVIKYHLKNFNYKIIQEIFIAGFKIDQEIDINSVLVEHNEGTLNGKILIHSDNHLDFIYNNSKLENLHKKIGLKNKFIIHNFYKNIVRTKYPLLYNNIIQVNYELISVLNFIKNEFKDMDENLLRPIVEVECDFLIDKNQYKNLNELLSFYNHRRIISILSHSTHFHELKETLYMFEQLKRYAKANKIDIQELMPHSPHRLRNFHDTFQGLISKIGRDNIPINANLPNEIKELDGKSFYEYNISIPKSNSELIIIGQQLSICVGNSHYAEEMALGKNIILLLKKNGKVHYCVEYNTVGQMIIQANTYYNTKMDKFLEEKLQAFLKQ